MLSKPDAGWTDFSLDNEHSYSLSYLTDVGIEWLDQAIHGLTTMEPFAVHAFCEPDRVVCTVSYWNTYIVFESDGIPEKNAYREMYGVGLSMIDFCKLLYEDIFNNIDAWVKWDDSSLHMLAEDKYDEMIGDEYIETEFEKVLSDVYAARTEEFTNRLEKLKQLIYEQAEHFGSHRCFF